MAIDSTGAAGAATGAAGATGTGSSGDGGNAALEASFNSAIEKANKTLALTTEKGAELYALKQRVG